MTVENCIKLLKSYEERIANPPGIDAVWRGVAKRTAEEAYADMKAHILSSRKFKGHPILDELKQKPKPKKEEEEKEEDGEEPEG